MLKRLINLSNTHSFFLFGARGTGKSTLLAERLKDKTFLNLNLLDSEVFDKLVVNPNYLKELVGGFNQEEIKNQFCIIDEVQKVPAVLDVVHKLIFEKKCHFALSGSSARKLKRGGANLLAGRAFLFNLFPLTFQELTIDSKTDKKLKSVLQYGSLPEIYTLSGEIEKERFLKSYVNTYLKEEVLQEQIIRNLRPFRLFLDVAAQCNGEELNFSKIARQIGVDDSTVRSYFDILEETLIGFMLYPTTTSIRKRINKSPKFFLFDIGVKAILAERSVKEPIEGTESFGRIFEHFVILEIHRLNFYLEKEYEMSFIRTPAGVEVDLIIKRPGNKDIYIEIKSTKNITKDHISSQITLAQELKDTVDFFCFSQDQETKLIEGIKCLPWDKGIVEIYST